MPVAKVCRAMKAGLQRAEHANLQFNGEMLRFCCRFVRFLLKGSLICGTGFRRNAISLDNSAAISDNRQIGTAVLPVESLRWSVVAFRFAHSPTLRKPVMSDLATSSVPPAAASEPLFSAAELKQFEDDDVEAGLNICKMLSMFFFYTVIVMGLSTLTTLYWINK